MIEKKMRSPEEIERLSKCYGEKQTLTFEATGMLRWMLYQPIDSVIDVRILLKAKSDSPKHVKKIINELVKAGYFEPCHSDSRKIRRKDSKYIFHAEPETSKKGGQPS